MSPRSPDRMVQLLTEIRALFDIAPDRDPLAELRRIAGEWRSLRQRATKTSPRAPAPRRDDPPDDVFRA